MMSLAVLTVIRSTQNDYRPFRAHCVSHHLQAKSGRHRALTLRDRLPKSSTEAVRLAFLASSAAGTGHPSSIGL
jgi:hypothetical protein